MKRIGVIGCGVVGQAVLKGLKSSGFIVHGYDKFKHEFSDWPQVFNTAAVFVCVPTATKDDGTQDLEPLDEVFAMLRGQKYAGTIVVKSTVLPGTTQAMGDKWGFEKVVHNPEFLTARNAEKDFMDQASVLLGSKSQDALDTAQEIYLEAGFGPLVIANDCKVTELAKYMHNLFLSTKVEFCNFIFDVCEHHGVKYDAVLAAALTSGGIGEGHTKVPGPDGIRGFGGMCFTKDTAAFLRQSKDLNIPCEQLDATVGANRARRQSA